MTIVEDGLQSTLTDTVAHSMQYYTAKVKIFEQHWNVVQTIHVQILDLLDDIDTGEYDLNDYIRKEEKFHTELLKIKALGEDNANTPIQMHTPAISHLPKVTLPQFDGDYLKWQQFHDLFH